MCIVEGNVLLRLDCVCVCCGQREMCFIVFKEDGKSGVLVRVIDRVKLYKSSLTC